MEATTTKFGFREDEYFTLPHIATSTQGLVNRVQSLDKLPETIEKNHNLSTPMFETKKNRNKHIEEVKNSPQ